MPLKVTTSTKTGETRFLWTSDDETSEAAWRLKADADEVDILSIMEKVVRFVRSQRHERDQGISEVKQFLMNDLATVEALPEFSPADLPSDGGPPPSANGWAGMRGSVRPAIPPHLQGDWEYIEPGDM